MMILFHQSKTHNWSGHLVTDTSDSVQEETVAAGDAEEAAPKSQRSSRLSMCIGRGEDLRGTPSAGNLQTSTALMKRQPQPAQRRLSRLAYRGKKRKSSSGPR